jgi:NADH:ubiquinone oxidoreductase subunit 4 (subunit M)
MSIQAQVLETSPLIVTFASAALSRFYDLGKKWQSFVLFLLAALCVFFVALFFVPELAPVHGAESFFDVRLTRITLFIGSIFCGSLFIGLWPVRHEITISSRFILFIAGGLGIILANNLPTFFLFLLFQRSIPLIGFLRDIRDQESSGGGTFIIQHLLTFVLSFVLMYLAWSQGHLYTPMSQIPASFFTWPVLILAFIIIYTIHGIFPFHSWVHEVVGHLPWYEISSIFLPRAGILLFVQLILPTLGQDPDAFKILLLSLSIFSSVYWSFRGLFETNVNKVVTYFYVAQTSLILTGLQADVAASKGAFLHMMVISVSGTALWSILSYIQTVHSMKRTSQFYGLAQFFPKLSTLFCLFGFCMIGVPLGASFVVEDLVITGLLAQQPYLGLGHILATCLNGILFFVFFSKIFLGKVPYPQEIKNRDLSITEMAPYIFSLVLMLLIGIMPSLFLDRLTW